MTYSKDYKIPPLGKTDCDICSTKVNHIWQCWQLYDGNTCPVYRKASDRDIQEYYHITNNIKGDLQ